MHENPLNASDTPNHPKSDEKGLFFPGDRPNRVESVTQPCWVASRFGRQIRRSTIPASRLAIAAKTNQCVTARCRDTASIPAATAPAA